MCCWERILGFDTTTSVLEVWPELRGTRETKILFFRHTGVLQLEITNKPLQRIQIFTEQKGTKQIYKRHCACCVTLLPTVNGVKLMYGVITVTDNNTLKWMSRVSSNRLTKESSQCHVGFSLLLALQRVKSMNVGPVVAKETCVELSSLSTTKIHG